MINTDHHLKAAIKRLTALIESEKENDIELNPAIVNIDEQTLINFCKEKGCVTPTYDIVDGGKYLTSVYWVNEGYIFLRGITVPNINYSECHVD